MTSKYSFKDAFSDFCPLLQTPDPDLCVIVEFLYYLHIPPPPNVSNFADFASFLWLSIVKVYATDVRCRYIHIVIDKPEFLPLLQTLVHKSRSKKSGSYSGHEPQISGPIPVPHGKSYTALISSSKVFKANLIKYITFLFIEWGRKPTNNAHHEDLACWIATGALPEHWRCVLFSLHLLGLKTQQTQSKLQTFRGMPPNLPKRDTSPYMLPYLCPSNFLWRHWIILTKLSLNQSPATI